jgi:hypothetical protein
MTLTDNLFLQVSKPLGVRVTPENLRSRMEEASSVGKINGKVKTDIIIELLLAFAELEQKVLAKGTEAISDAEPV